jgi:hypothetical protein
MALKDVKPNSSGGKGQARFVTRAEVKTAGKKIRRADDAATEVEPPDDAMCRHESAQPGIICVACIDEQLAPMIAGLHEKAGR